MLTALTDLEDTTAQQQARISALTALIEDWTTESRSKLERVRLTAKSTETKKLNFHTIAFSRARCRQHKAGPP